MIEDLGEECEPILVRVPKRIHSHIEVRNIYIEVLTFNTALRITLNIRITFQYTMPVERSSLHKRVKQI